MSEPMTNADARKGPEPEVFVLDDDAIITEVMKAILSSAGFAVRCFATGKEMLDALADASPRVLCLDLVLPDMGGEQVMLEVRKRRPQLPVIVISTQESVRRAIGIMKLKPFDYFVKPVDQEHLLYSIQSALRQSDLQDRADRLQREVEGQFPFEEIIGKSDKLQLVFDQIQQVLDAPISVFISGQSGTGKELVARAIHYHGVRREGPFVALNCGAIPESLQESELFGHEKGAFTGAVSTHRGRFEQANGGTLFLDEVGELSASAQTRLLRVLQEGTVQRVGGSKDVPVDVRIISATHRDLERRVREGLFREDLYYRIMVFPIALPPLRERVEDIPLLAGHFLRKHKRAGTDVAPIERDALDVLCRYDWPGNVRELENVIQRAVVVSRGKPIHVDALPPKLVLASMGLADPEEGVAAAESAANAAGATPSPAADGEILPIAELERRAIEHALRKLDGNVSLAAKRLGLGRATLYRKLAQLGLLKAE
ncbi:MAG: sigma-54-dependent Fis family transcriptional regulator [Candidatus Eisenbacteria bacterium]|nr:sigma-54-dependent Fis family transcriptional regulator [Candidatus Eisenbacteria bacterium]